MTVEFKHYLVRCGRCISEDVITLTIAGVKIPTGWIPRDLQCNSCGQDDLTVSAITVHTTEVGTEEGEGG